MTNRPIPASRALIAWGYKPEGWSLDASPAVAVGHLLDDRTPDWTKDYESTGGASTVYRRELAGMDQRFHVLRDYTQLVYTYGIDPHVVYTAFLNIKEFQEIVKEAGMGPDKGEQGHDPNVGFGRLVDSPKIEIKRFWHSVHVLLSAPGRQQG